MNTNKSMKLLPMFRRPREKMKEKGVMALTDLELLIVLLGSGSGDLSVFKIAESILSKYTVYEMKGISLESLMKNVGIGMSKGSAIAAAIELGRRMYSVTNPIHVKKPEDVVTMTAKFQTKKKEYFVGIYLDARNQFQDMKTISVGTVNMSVVHPREVFLPAILNVSSGVVLAHNHPSGDCEPSDADIILTERLVKAGSLLGIEVIDHIIVSKESWFSMKSHNIVF